MQTLNVTLRHEIPLGQRVKVRFRKDPDTGIVNTGIWPSDFEGQCGKVDAVCFTTVLDVEGHDSWVAHYCVTLESNTPENFMSHQLEVIE